MRREILEKIKTARRQKRPVVLITNLDSGAQGLCYADGEMFGGLVSDEHKAMVDKVLREDKCQTFATSAGKVFLQVFNPPLRMIIVGAVHIAQALVSMAELCGYEVALIDPRSAFGNDARFSGVHLVNEWPDKALKANAPDCRTAIITLAHDPKLDDPALEVALRSDAFYIGSLGSRKTQAAREKRLIDKGFTKEMLARIQGPIGLDIGGRSPAEIAISIMAEVTQTLRKA
ncbi:MAG: XdhC family protein [Gammaproteobacteria bacterium]